MLDFTKLGGALQAFQEIRTARRAHEERRLAQLRAAYVAAGERHVELLKKIESEKRTITWNVGVPVAPLGPSVPVVRHAAPYAIVAADGSSMEPDAHENPDYYIVNIGVVRIVYGLMPSAAIQSLPHLEYAPEKLQIGTGSRARPKGAREVALERDIAEIEALVAALAQLPPDVPRVAFIDGSLIRWDLETLEEEIREPFLARYLAALDACRDAGVPIVGYIAASQSRELVNFLRLALCPHTPSPCEGEEAPCAELNGALDRDILAAQLTYGERGPILQSHSRILARYEDHPIFSTALHVGQGIVRVEFPGSVIASGQLDFVLGVILDQCRKGDGYPPVLQEAHEAAVLTMSDRSALRAWVEQVTNQRRTSAKAASKRMKRV